jgi:hypothetical protein
MGENSGSVDRRISSEIAFCGKPELRGLQTNPFPFRDTMIKLIGTPVLGYKNSRLLNPYWTGQVYVVNKGITCWISTPTTPTFFSV